MFDVDVIGFFSTKLEKLMKNVLEELNLGYTINIYSNFKIFGTDLIE